MRIPDDRQSQRVGVGAGLCPRMHWRSMNPALPPPESIPCFARGPDCCATSAAADARRVA